MASLSDPARGRPAVIGSAAARAIFVVVLALFALAVLVQVDLAGDAALIDPDAWPRHVAWVHTFQWISVVLPVAAYLGGSRLGMALLCCLPMAVLGAQYKLVHMGVNGGDARYVGLHAVGGVIMFGILVFIGQEWRYRAR